VRARFGVADQQQHDGDEAGNDPLDDVGEHRILLEELGLPVAVAPGPAVRLDQ
jgi:hypothetical protein